MQDIFKNFDDPKEYELTLALYRKNEISIKAIAEYLRSLEDNK